MSERLVIRLGSQANEPISWLVWSDSEQEIIASGTLSNAHELATLSQRTTGDVEILVPGGDVSLFEVELPTTNRRQALKAIPFMLEDELATDIEQLHFVQGKKTGNKQSVFVVDKAKIVQWSAWLEQANIGATKMLPDWLALPEPSTDGAISVMQLEQQILTRQGEQRGASIATSWFEPWLSLVKQQQSSLSLESYGVSEQLLTSDVTWQSQELMMPMQRLALGYQQTGVNLLVGEFAVKDQQQRPWQAWRNVALVAGIALVLIFVEKLYQINRIEAQQSAVAAQSVAIFRQLNPDAKRVNRLKYRISQQLKQVGSSGNDSKFLVMMTSLNRGFAKVPQLKPVSVKFDNKRQEIRVQANGDNYQQFEQFKQTFGSEYSVTTGAMNNNGNQVNGSLVIKAAS